MKPSVVMGVFAFLTTEVALLTLILAGAAQAASLSMPAGARSWIVVSSSDCDDDGSGTADRGHCVAAVSVLNQAGDLGHDIFANYQILASASIMPDAMRGSIQSTPAHLFVFLDMSMIDTYTLQSSTLPAGTVVPVAVTFRAVGTMYPENFFSTAWGGGTFAIRIGNSFSNSPIVIPENNRVNAPFGAGASASYFINLAPNGTPIPLDLTAVYAFDAAIGTPFDLAYYLGARPAASTIEFSNTANISFTLPEGVAISSTGGYGLPTAVVPATWSEVKARYTR